MLQRISEEHRQILILREYENYGYNEIAETLDISLEVVKSRLFRARSEMRKLLQGYFKEQVMKDTDLQLLVSAFADGEISHTERVMAEDHLDVCKECRDFLAEIQVVHAHIRHEGHIQVSPGFAMRVLDQLRERRNSSPLVRCRSGSTLDGRASTALQRSGSLFLAFRIRCR